MKGSDKFSSFRGTTCTDVRTSAEECGQHVRLDALRGGVNGRQFALLVGPQLLHRRRGAADHGPLATRTRRRHAPSRTGSFRPRSSQRSHFIAIIEVTKN